MTSDIFPEGMLGASADVRDVSYRRDHIFLYGHFNSIEMFTQKATCDDPGVV